MDTAERLMCVPRCDSVVTGQSTWHFVEMTVGRFVNLTFGNLAGELGSFVC